LILLAHPNCPTDLLVEACSADSPDVRAAAARNANCPDEGRVIAALLDRVAR